MAGSLSCFLKDEDYRELTMKDCIIFGAGFTGKNVCQKLKQIYHIVGFADNNQVMWGKSIQGLPVIPPGEIKKYTGDVVICSDYFQEIQKQLLDMGITNIRLIEPNSYLMYEYGPDNKMMPVTFPELNPPFQKNSKRLHVLFVQQIPCIRTYKIASAIQSKGFDVSLAHTAGMPGCGGWGQAGLWTQEATFFSMQDLLQYVNKSGYDLIHCSNEPDSLACLLLGSNKPVVHDTHDFMCINYKADRDMLAMEYMANTRSQGLIYVNEENLQMAQERFHINKEKAIVIENRPSEAVAPKTYLRKLSADDHEVHCVYEGGIHKNPAHFRNVEGIWLQLALSGVHVHFYTQADPDYCRAVAGRHKNIHYEGMLGISELITELTKYDCGLLLFKDLPEYRIVLDTALPNKIFEYLMAGLPEAVGDVKSHKKFVEKYATGACLDFQKDLKTQLAAIAQIPIEKDFIKNHRLTDAGAGGPVS